MAIVIKTAPGNFYSAQGDLIFVVSEAVKANDPTTYPDYKYVADIYIGAVQVARIKKVPNPTNKFGIFNIGDIVRGYLETTFNPDNSNMQAQQLGLAEFLINCTVKFGEEYGFTLYTNLLIDSERIYFNHYNGRLLGENTALTDYLDKVVSSRPYATPLNPGDIFTFLPYLPSTDDPFDVTIVKFGSSTGLPVTISWGHFDTDIYSTVDSQVLQFSTQFLSGSNAYTLNYTSAANEKYLVVKEPVSQPVKTTWLNTTFNYGTIPDFVFRDPVIIGGYRYYVSRNPVVLDSLNFAIKFGNASSEPTSPVVGSTITETITPDAANVLQILNVSPAVINSLAPGFIDDSTIYYTVQIGDTSIYRFNLACELRFEVYRVHFLNQFGGFESRDFTKISRKTLAITKTDFGKLPYIIDISGNVNYYNSNKVYNETKSTYASQYTEKLTLNTDSLSDAEYTWLSQLVLSPMIYVEIGGFFIPAAITKNSYIFNKHVNDKLTSLTIDLNFGDQFNAQYR